MPYDVMERRIKELPTIAQEEIYHYVNYIYSIYTEEPKIVKDTSFIDDMVGILSHEEAEELLRHCHLNFKETV